MRVSIPHKALFILVYLGVFSLLAFPWAILFADDMKHKIVQTQPVVSDPTIKDFWLISAAPAPYVTKTLYSAGQPLRLVFFGDSLPGGIMSYVKASFLASGLPAEFASLTVVSSSLTRNDFFDWSAEASKVLDQYDGGQADAIAVMIGANDSQDILKNGSLLKFGTDAWKEEFSARTSKFMDILDRKALRVYWFALPPMADPVYAARILQISALCRSCAAKYRSIRWVDLKTQLLDDAGLRRKFFQYNGLNYPLFVFDGVHLDIGAGLMIGQSLEILVRDDFRFAH